MAEDLRECGPEDSRRFITAAMNSEGEEALRNAPASLREFFREAETPPEWLDYSAFAPGVRMFHRNSLVILAAFVSGVLIEGFTTNIAKSFFHHRAGARAGRQAFGAEQPPHDGDIPSRRHVQGWKWLETFGPYQNNSRTVKTPPERFGRLEQRSLGFAD